MMRLNIFEPMSIRLIILNWFGSSGCLHLGSGVPVPWCHSSYSFSPSQKSQTKPNTILRLVLLRALNASAGMPFAPGGCYFSFA